MRTLWRAVSSIVLLTIIASAAQAQNTALLLTVNSAIGPATQDFIQSGLTQAEKQNVQVLILQLDTPGGLEKSMRNIVSDILASPIPVIAYVAPSGARAASAGTYIVYASHIAAMAPGTNLGAATPVSIGLSGMEEKSKNNNPSAEEKKTMNDAVASIRSLAELRGRNAQWAEQAVRQGASISATEALQLKVINVIANNILDLLSAVNGDTVSVAGKPQQLMTTGLAVQEFKPDWRTRFLAVITDPSVAYILLMIGMWGLFFEFANPGFVLPGVSGAIALLLALYAFQLLPINYVGLALILLGIAFMITEAFVASFGALGIGGVIAFVVGSVLLLEKGAVGYQIAWPVIVAVSATTAAFFLLVINIALRARFRPIVSGREEVVNQVTTVQVDDKGALHARVLGEMWQVRCEMPLQSGQKIKVIAIDGLSLIVKPI
jgi:membrane-bound serine protease (ClpP class)